MLSRRGFLTAAVTLPLAAKKKRSGLKLGVMDGVLGKPSDPSAAALASGFGLAGLQVTLGQPQGDAGMPLESAEAQTLFVYEAARNKVALDATYLDVLHVNCLKDDPLAPKLVAKGIEITKRLRAPILMTVFFGKCAILNRAELDRVADIFKDLAREAEKAGVIIGFENLLSAEDNARAMDRVGSNAFKIYYDVGNATNIGGFDAPKEIRFLGKDRICQFHFKDKGYLGEGKVNFPEVLKAIEDIGFEGYANLETSSPSGEMVRDLRRNLTFLQKLMPA